MLEDLADRANSGVVRDRHGHRRMPARVKRLKQLHEEPDRGQRASHCDDGQHAAPDRVPRTATTRLRAADGASGATHGAPGARRSLPGRPEPLAMGYPARPRGHLVLLGGVRKVVVVVHVRVPGELGALRQTLISIGIRTLRAAFGADGAAIPCRVGAGAVAVGRRRGQRGLDRGGGLCRRSGLRRRSSIGGALLAPALTLEPGRLALGGRPLARVSHPRPPCAPPGRRASPRADMQPRGSPRPRTRRFAGRAWS